MIYLRELRVLTLILVLFVAAAQSANSMAASLAAGKKESKEKTAQEIYRRSFQDYEITVILGYFRGTENLPPGLTKKEKLPPGLEKQVRERGTLPPGLQKRIRPLPLDLERKLPRLPERQLRVLIGVDVVLMDTEDNIILDVIEGVLGRH